jgi:hypothetical protein
MIPTQVTPFYLFKLAGRNLRFPPTLMADTDEQQRLTTISATGTPPPNIQVFPLSEWVPRSSKGTETGPV